MNEKQYPDFEPSETTLRAFLSTRKRPIRVGNKEFSGLFVTEGFAKDTRFFLAAVLIELSVIFGIIVGGMLGTSKGFQAALILAVLIVGLDVLGVWVHHFKVRKRVLLACMREVRLNDRPDIDLELGQPKYTTFLGWLALIGSAIFKIVSVWLFFAFANWIAMTMLIAAYLFVAYVHGFHTGYWYAEYKRRRLLKVDHKKWARSLRANGSDGQMNEVKRLARTTNVVNHAKVRYLPLALSAPDVKLKAIVLRSKEGDSLSTLFEKSMYDEYLKESNNDVEFQDVQSTVGNSREVNEIQVNECIVRYAKTDSTGRNWYRIFTYGLVDDAVVSEFGSTQADDTAAVSLVTILREFQLTKFTSNDWK